MPYAYLYHQVAVLCRISPCNTIIHSQTLYDVQEYSPPFFSYFILFCFL